MGRRRRLPCVFRATSSRMLKNGDWSNFRCAVSRRTKGFRTRKLGLSPFFSVLLERISQSKLDDPGTGGPVNPAERRRVAEVQNYAAKIGMVQRVEQIGAELD